MDYRDVLATVVGASVAGIVAFFIRLVFPVNAAVLALIYAATYSLLWSLVGDASQRIFKKHLPANTRLDGHWRLISGGIALAAALCAGLIVAFAVSRSSFPGDGGGTTNGTELVTRTLALQQRVVVTNKTIVLPVRTVIQTGAVTQVVVTTAPGATVTGAGTSTIFSRTVVVERPPVTVTVASTRSRTVTETTPTVTTPPVTLPPVTTSSVTTVVATVPATVPTTSTDTTPAAPITDPAPGQ
jgi:hypothetical protein